MPTARKHIPPLFPAMYFPPIVFWMVWKRHRRMAVETADHYQKGTYRNRMHIASANGFSRLSVPLLKGKNQHSPMATTAIDYRQDWRRHHFRALHTAYGKSPFFDHYADELMAFYEREYASLLELNLASIRLVHTWLLPEYPLSLTDHFRRDYPPALDFRDKMKANRELNISFAPYVQVFASMAGFVPNLTILDLIFCTGPEALRYL